MTDKTNTASASATVSVPLATVLVVLLAVAKVENIYGLGDLSWWWVFAPYWLGLVVVFAMLLLFGIIFGVGAGIVSVIDAHDRKKRAKAREERIKKNTLR